MLEQVVPQTNASPLVTQSFHDRKTAEQAYATLVTRGYGNDDVHVFMSDDTRKRFFTDTEPKTDLGQKAAEGAGVGGAIGGVVGATLLGVVAAGTALTVPGLGLLIAGPIAGALAGGATGAAAGGLLGVLVGAGMPEDRAKTHESDLRQGRIVLSVKPRHDDDAKFLNGEWMTPATTPGH